MSCLVECRPQTCWHTRLRILSFSYRLNPEWGPEHHSTFVLNTHAEKLLEAKGLTFVVKDFDLLSPDEDLGTIQVSLSDLSTHGAMVKMLERKITPPKGAEVTSVGYLTLHIRQATDDDEKSLAKGELKRLFEPRTEGFDHGGDESYHEGHHEIALL